MNLHLIFARTRKGVIGKDNALPWHLPEDLAHFKRQTMGCPVIMGRKTWDSLPPRFRPLPGRINVVLTRQPHWVGISQAQPDHVAIRADSLEHAMQLCGDAPDVWIIGGAQLYALAEPLATTAVVTEVDIDIEGDAFAPILGAPWVEIAREEHKSANGLRFRFISLKKSNGV